ncbi:MAG: phosphoenolpyruvate--protein phosphotransferase [Luteolibacter sp.]
MQDFSFVFPLPNGMHARPASQLEGVAARFSSAIHLHCERNGNRADAHSVLALISADIRHGDDCILQVDGADEETAFETIVHYLNNEFPHCDEALSAVSEGATTGKLPKVLAAFGVERWWSGQPVYGGLAVAPLVSFGGLKLAEGFVWPPAESAENERIKLTAALDAARKELDHQIRTTSGQTSEILSAQAGMLSDRSFATKVGEHLDQQGGNAGEAVLAVTATLSATLRAGSVYLQERVADLQDVAARIITGLYGENATSNTPVLTHPTILAATELTPGQFLALDHSHLRGIVLENGGATSHTSILARAAGIPLMVGTKGCASLATRAEAILDTRRGILLVDPAAHVSSFYQRESGRFAEAALAASTWAHLPAISADGDALPLHANVASAKDVRIAIERGAEGIGLFRTELLFMNRSAAPDEEEQVAIYTEALRHAAGHPLVIRTLDIGGDKPVPYLDLPVEPNPFLGLRGVRLYGRLSALIKTQLRALLRASVHGPLKIMVPMIACADEMSNFRTLLEQCRIALQDEGRGAGDQIAIGAMLEIPSAIFDLPEISRHADFFSIGSNDLAQYFLAADRDNPATADLGTWKHPAFIRLLKMATVSAHAAGRPIGLCGDLASRPEALPLLFALGFDSISLGGAGIAPAKITLSRITRTAADEQLAKILLAPDRAAVVSLLSTTVRGDLASGLLASELFQVISLATSKAEAINELVALVDAAGRTHDAAALEEAVWTREEAYATNFGYGFAVPHCQTAHVSEPVITLVRLAKPVAWSEGDDNLVHVALLLAMPAGENREHLRIFARLSRLIMREEFRNALEAAPDSDALLAVLADALGPVGGAAV